MTDKSFGLRIIFSKTEGLELDAFALKSAVRTAVKTALSCEGFSADAEVSVTFSSGEYIRELNSSHRGVDRVTDVLSFPIYEREELSSLPREMPITLGDIVICLSRAGEQAGELGNTLIEEVSFLAVHSTLHLLGYDHERSPEDDELQCSRQRVIIEKIKSLKGETDK